MRQMYLFTPTVFVYVEYVYVKLNIAHISNNWSCRLNLTSIYIGSALDELVFSTWVGDWSNNHRE